MGQPKNVTQAIAILEAGDWSPTDDMAQELYTHDGSEVKRAIQLLRDTDQREERLEKKFRGKPRKRAKVKTKKARRIGR